VHPSQPQRSYVQKWLYPFKFNPSQSSASPWSSSWSLPSLDDALQSHETVSRSVPRAKSQSLNSTSSPLGSLQHPHLGHHMLCRSGPITPDQVPWASPCRICCYGQNPDQKARPWPQGCGGLPRSCGHHMTIMQPCTTHAISLAGHLASGPGTLRFQPSFFAIYLHLIVC